MAYDLSSAEFLADPAPQLAAMRNEAAVVQVKLPIIGDTWLTTTDAAARSLLKSPDIFARDPTHSTGKTLAQKYWFLPPFIRPLFQNMLGCDGADHKRLRGLVDQALRKTSAQDMTPRLARIADELLDQTTGQTVDIVKQYTRPLPLMAICDLLGVSQDERSRVAGWISPLSGPTSAWGLLRGLPGLSRIMRYFRRDFDRVRQTPRPGLTEEFMHFYSPTMMIKPHFVQQDTVLEDVSVNKGDQVVALLISANRDELRFDVLHSFVPSRRPNRHLGFGHRPHVCLGMPLARTEAQVALTRLFTHFPKIALASPEAPAAHTKRLGMHGLSRLDVTLG